MNDNSKRVKWLLAVGSTLIYMAGLSFFTSSIANDALKVILNTLISVALLAVSIGVEDSFKLKGLGKYSFILGLISFISTFIFIGGRGMFGDYFSTYGEGTYLYYSFLSLLVAIFSYISYLRYKDFMLVHIKYSALLVCLYTFMCQFSSNITANLSVIGIILLFLNIIKVTDNSTRFAKVGSLLYSIITFISLTSIFSSGNINSIFAWVIIVTNAINIFLVLLKDKRTIVNIIAIFLYTMNVNMITSYIMPEANYGLTLLISAIFFAILELLLNYFNVIKDKRVAIFNKIIINLCYLELFSLTNGVLEYGILTAIVFGTSFINSFVYRNDDYEYNIISLKLIFIGNTIFQLVSNNIITLNGAIYYIFLDLIFLAVMYFTKNDKHKIESTVLTLYYCGSLLFYEHLTPALYVGAGLIAMLNYYIVILKNNDEKSTKGRLYYGFILLMLLVSLEDISLNNSKYLIASLVFGILSFLSYGDRVGFAITLPALYLSLSGYISGLDRLNDSIISLLSMINTYACFTLWINNTIEKEQTKITLQAISLVMISLISVFTGYVLNTLLTIVIAVLMIYQGMKSKKLDAIHNSGVAIVIIALLSLTSYLGEARLFIYLLVVGGGIIYFVIRLAAKGIPNLDEKNEKVESKSKVIINNDEIPKNKNNITNKIAFCYNCGNHLKGDEIFCGKCGTKLK